jgi:hypothetical protein
MHTVPTSYKIMQHTMFWWAAMSEVERLKYWHHNYRQGDIVAYTWIVFLIEFNCGKYTPLNELLI